MAILDTEIKREVKDDLSKTGDSKEITYNHESFGMAKISHITGNSKTFGSEIESSSMIELTISGCEVTQDLGQNWYHPNKCIAKVRFSAVQFAEFITNPNGMGTPCTVGQTDQLGRIKQKHIDTQTEHVESKIKQTVEQLHKNVGTLQKDIDAVLNKKGVFKKEDKDDIRKLLNNSIRLINDQLPFYEKCMEENIDILKSEARADINTHIQHSINATGLAVLQDPKLINLLLEKK